MTMRVQERDIASFVRNYTSNIQSAGESRKINIRFNSSNDSINLFIDPEKMDKIFMNLLSNALKFTGRGGVITISLLEDNDNCRIIIEDTGEGIPEKSINTIFDRFSQADTSATRKHEGTGIGLALAKELVEMHYGTIAVTSRYIKDHPDEHGSVFTITLPKGSAHFANNANVKFIEKSDLDDCVKDHRFIGMREMEELRIRDASDASCESIEEPLTHGVKKTILVVDDNPDMRNFIKILLQKQYRVIHAENGEDGIRCARSQRPDLIVTDVMMPVMNGFEMTSIIKNDNELKTIPVIMLTADTELVSKVAGLEYGADDYLNKPFNSIELMTRISSLLKNYEYQQVIARRNRDIESELEVARMLQQRLLPESMPEISGYRAHAIYIPMDRVGGDFYDIEILEGCINIFIADVSGHGLPGAFLATVAKIALENITMRTTSNKVLYLLNNVITRHTVMSNYVTAFYALIDIKTNVMRFSCAGHVPPLLYRKKSNEFMELKAKGTPLGWFKNTQIEEKMIQLESGDRIVFYTDGITECSNPSNELFEDAKFQNTIREHSGLSAEEFSRELMKELEAYKGQNKFNDDITMVVLDVL